jgi:hypothetical protein
MKTAALLPTSGDPYLAAYWCRNYERVWRGEVDELNVLLNGHPAAAETYRSVGANVTITAPIGHGQALNMLIAQTDADAIVTFEDDCFVRTPGAIRGRLARILSGEDEVIGCPRGGMSPEVEAASKAKWGWPEGPDTSSGTGIWPAFLFARPSDLRAVEMLRCESLTWQPGDVIPGLDWTCPAEMTTDTMTLMAFQLRARHRITPDVQYKEMWQKDYAAMKALTGEPPWFHAGGMANELPHVGRPNIGMESNEGRDWAHRLWWRRHVGLDDSADAARMQVDPDYWNGKAEPWINWNDQP